MSNEKRKTIRSQVILWEDLVIKFEDNGFDSLLPSQQIYFAVSLLLGDVSNGGLYQYFHNPSSDYIYVALEGIKILEAYKTLAIIERAIALFFPYGQVPDNCMERRAMLPKHSFREKEEPEWVKIEEELNHEFFEDPEAIADRLEAYAERNNLYELSEANVDIDLE